MKPDFRDMTPAERLVAMRIAAALLNARRERAGVAPRSDVLDYVLPTVREGALDDARAVMDVLGTVLRDAGR